MFFPQPLATLLVCVLALGAGNAAEPGQSAPLRGPATTPAVAPVPLRAFEKVASQFITEYCVNCHGPKQQKGKLRLDTLGGDLQAKTADLAMWKRVLEQLESEEMPPDDAKTRPKPGQAGVRATCVPVLDGAQRNAGRRVDAPGGIQGIQGQPRQHEGTDHVAAYLGFIFVSHPHPCRERSAGRAPITTLQPPAHLTMNPLPSINRRTMLKGLAASAGGALFSPFTWPQLLAANGATAPKRFVFFLQNHGFNPQHATPEGVHISEKTLDHVQDLPLATMRLPKFIDPLAPYMNRLTIVQGLNGRHVVPYHSAPYGALGGFKKSASMPMGETIDCALSRALPAVVPLLALGWESMANMQASPIYYASSAWGTNKAVPMYCDPVLAYKNLFGVAKPGKDRNEFEADTELYDFIKRDSEKLNRRLTGIEQEKFHPYLEGHEDAAVRRRKLLLMASTLEKHAPAMTEKFTRPQFETDWWDAGLTVAIGALTSGVTNVVTISSGLCTVGSSWFGIGATTVGHKMGHTDQMENPDWLKLRRYNMGHLVQIIKALEATPEGSGTMMDNTLIVYTSCSGEKQHSTGNR